MFAQDHVPPDVALSLRLAVRSGVLPVLEVQLDHERHQRNDDGQCCTPELPRRHHLQRCDGDGQ